MHPLPHRRWGSPPAGREGAVQRSRTEATVGAWVFRAVARPLRRSAPPPRRCAAGRRVRGHVKDLIAAARGARAVPRRTWGPSGRGGGAERGPGARGPLVCGSFGSRRLERSAEPVGRGALPAGIVPPLQDAVRDAWCASRLRAGLPRRAPGGRGRIRRARGPCGFLLPAGTFPPDPPARPPRARIQDALPTPRGRDGLCARPPGVSATLRSATADPLRCKRLHAARRVG